VKRLAACFVLAATASLASQASAGAYRIELAVPANGKLLHGHGGLEAADDRTATALVRLISPGNDIHEVGTVRVLVMNLGTKSFEVGPDEVTLTLADGTVLKPVSIDRSESGRELVERETRHAMAQNMQNRNNMSGLAGQASRGVTAQSMSPSAAAPGSTGSGTEGQDRRADDSLLPGVQLLDSIYQILIPLSVEPQKAWGGYYLFDMPKTVFRRKLDQPLTIDVRTGAEQHRFAATLKWK
jgi:hypothetical protein